VTKSAVVFTSHIQDFFFQNIVSRRKKFITFEARLFPKLPSELMFAQSDLKEILLGSLAYGVVTVKGRVTCITNEVISLRHGCVFKAYFCEIDSPIKLANSKA